MPMVSNLDLIRRVPFFTNLTAAQAQSISRNVAKRRYRRGDNIVEEGRKSEALFILLNGRVRVYTADTRGREVILAQLHAGDYIGEMSLIDNEPHSASVMAEVQTDVLVLDRADFFECLADNASLALSVMRGLVRRLRLADRQIQSLALQNVHERVARTLRSMAQDEDGEPVIRGRVSRQHLARMVGASREMVSRVMRSMEESGAVELREDGSLLLRSVNKTDE